MGSGRGQATFRVDRGSGGRVDYFIDTVRFEFADDAAVPEPASVLLLGGALTGLWLRRRGSPGGHAPDAGMRITRKVGKRSLR